MENFDAGPMVNRLRMRHKILVDPHRDAFVGASVLVLGAGDGRWCYSIAAAGARRVIGVDESADLVARFARYPDIGLADVIEMRCACPCEAVMGPGEEIDIILMMDVLEHCEAPEALLDGVVALSPDLVILDAVLGADHLAKPDVAALVEHRGFDLTWHNWGAVAPCDRRGLDDYYRVSGRRRMSGHFAPRETVH